MEKRAELLSDVLAGLRGCKKLIDMKGINFD